MSAWRLFLAIAPIIGLAIDCMFHVAMARLMRSRNPYPALAIGAGAGLAGTIATTLAACAGDSLPAADTSAFVAMNTVASLALAFGYFNFVNLTVASLRIRLLEEIVAAGGRLPRAALLERYGTDSVADLRLERLVRGGHLVERNGRLYIGRLQFLMVARIFDSLRRLVFGSKYAAHRGGRTVPTTGPRHDGRDL